MAFVLSALIAATREEPAYDITAKTYVLPVGLMNLFALIAGAVLNTMVAWVAILAVKSTIVQCN